MKAVFSELVKAMSNQKGITVKTVNYIWYLYWENTNNKFWASIERISKHGKEQTKTYQDSTKFFEAIQNIAEIKNLKIVDNKEFSEAMEK
jgi:hypothetical protein